MSLLGNLTEPLTEHLLQRPLTVIELTGSLLTCDEPIVTKSARSIASAASTPSRPAWRGPLQATSARSAQP